MKSVGDELHEVQPFFTGDFYRLQPDGGAPTNGARGNSTART